jgi:hypothetical protein
LTKDSPLERETLQAAKTTLIALAVVGLISSGACTPRHPAAANAAAASSGSSEQGYSAAPDLTSALRDASGRMTLSGTASPGATVRLASPTAAARFANADAAGAWRIVLAPSPSPLFLGLSMSDGGRVVQSVGYVFVAPDGRVAKLKAGGGSEILSSRAGNLGGLTLDFDNQRAATLCGKAAPGEAVSLRVDGVERARAPADPTGRFTLSLNQPLAAGAHDFDLASPHQDLRFNATVDAPTPLQQTPFAAARFGQGWRIDWVTPGGGEQTTLVFDHLEPAS